MHTGYINKIILDRNAKGYSAPWYIFRTDGFTVTHRLMIARNGVELWLGGGL